MLKNGTGVFLQTFLYLVQNPGDYPSESNSLYNIQVDNEVTETKCYEPYGCFDISFPWTTESRPVSLFPESPEKINPRFALFTRNTLESPKFLDLYDPDTIRAANINSNGTIYLISHGYMEAGSKPWIHKMAYELLNRPDGGSATVIVIDWRDGSSPPYTQAVANIRLVGAMTGHLIGMIKTAYNMPDLDNVHIIGHSLGAHLAGYAGTTVKQELKMTLGRISGLDPAEPHFAKTDTIVRLDREDAKFVDVVHSDASPFISGGLGMSQQVGHVDFYPNGGSKQPGCDQGMLQYITLERGSFFRGMRRFFGCNHLRSYEYYTESISPSCPFMSISCHDYESLQSGECFHCGVSGQHCLQFGFHGRNSYRHLVENKKLTSSKSVSAYLMTGSQKPFCRAHYRITVNVSNSVDSNMHGGEVGTIFITIRSDQGTDTEKIPLTPSAKYYGPDSQHTVVVPGRDIAKLQSAILEWEYQTSIINPLTWRILASPRVHISWVKIESMEHRTSIRVCPAFDAPVVSSNPMLMKKDNCGSDKG